MLRLRRCWGFHNEKWKRRMIRFSVTCCGMGSSGGWGSLEGQAEDALLTSFSPLSSSLLAPWNSREPLSAFWCHSLPIAKLPSSNICTTYSLSHFIHAACSHAFSSQGFENHYVYIAEHACLFPLPFLSPNAFWLLVFSSYVCVLCVTCFDGV